MDRLELAILRTVLYADIFSFPMTIPEIHHFLIHDTPVQLNDIEYALANSPVLKQRLMTIQGYVVCNGHEDLVPLRLERERSFQQLWPRALHYGVWLSRLPFVRMVALTGALAMRNAASSQDDLDYLLVTAPHRVWLARLRGVEICPNYIVAESALEQQRRDLFIAHEVAQMVPLYGFDLYRRMRASNAWVDAHLPNAERMFHEIDEYLPGSFWTSTKRFLEVLLSTRIGDLLETWEYRRKLRRFAPEIQKSHDAARLDLQQIKGHFNDHGQPVLSKYQERLRQYGLEDAPALAPGD